MSVIILFFMLVAILFVFVHDAGKTVESNSYKAMSEHRTKELKEFCNYALESEIDDHINDYIFEINETLKNISPYIAENYIPAKPLKPASQIKKKDMSAYYYKRSALIAIALLNRGYLNRDSTVIPKPPSAACFCVSFDYKFCEDYYRWYQRRLNEIGIDKTVYIDNYWERPTWNSHYDSRTANLPIAEYYAKLEKNRNKC